MVARSASEMPCALGPIARPCRLICCGVRMPATTSSPCALIRNSPYRYSCSPVAGAAAEGHAGAGVVAHVAKDHGLHVDGGAPVVGDALVIAVGDRARAVPGVEDGLDRQVELLVGIGGELLAKVLLVHRLVLVHQALEPVQADVGVRAHALALLDLVQLFLKVLARVVHDNVGEHCDKAAVGVVGEPLVPGQLWPGRRGSRRSGPG